MHRSKPHPQQIEVLQRLIHIRRIDTKPCDLAQVYARALKYRCQIVQRQTKLTIDPVVALVQTGPLLLGPAQHGPADPFKEVNEASGPKTPLNAMCVILRTGHTGPVQAPSAVQVHVPISAGNLGLLKSCAPRLQRKQRRPSKIP